MTNSRDILLKLGDGADPGPESFSTIAGLKSKSISFGDSGIEATDDDSVDASNRLVRRIIDGGLNTLDVSGDFRLTASASQKELVAIKSGANQIRNWQVIIPGIGMFQGPFNLATLEMSGSDSAEEATGSLSLASAGAYDFTAEA